MKDLSIVMKVCGNGANTNFDMLHTRKLLHLLFALLGEFDATLEEDSTLEKDKQKTIENIDKLCNWLYGGYHSDSQLNFRK